MQALFDALKGQPTVWRLKNARLHVLKRLCEEFGLLKSLQTSNYTKSDYVSAIMPFVDQRNYPVSSLSS